MDRSKTMDGVRWINYEDSDTEPARWAAEIVVCSIFERAWPIFRLIYFFHSQAIILRESSTYVHFSELIFTSLFPFKHKIKANCALSLICWLAAPILVTVVHYTCIWVVYPENGTNLPFGLSRKNRNLRRFMPASKKATHLMLNEKLHKSHEHFKRWLKWNLPHLLSFFGKPKNVSRQQKSRTKIYLDRKSHLRQSETDSKLRASALTNFVIILGFQSIRYQKRTGQKMSLKVSASTQTVICETFPPFAKAPRKLSSVSHNNSPVFIFMHGACIFTINFPAESLRRKV